MWGQTPTEKLQASFKEAKNIPKKIQKREESIETCLSGKNGNAGLWSLLGDLDNRRLDVNVTEAEDAVLVKACNEVRLLILDLHALQKRNDALWTNTENMKRTYGWEDEDEEPPVIQNSQVHKVTSELNKLNWASESDGSRSVALAVAHLKLLEAHKTLRTK